MKIIELKKDDERYPENLRHIFDPPEKLYVWGEFRPEDKIAVAIVGSRKASLYGLQTAERLGCELASRGVTIISGLARGIDTAGHKGAVKAGGRTIAVLGSGLNDIYPPENKRLAEQIAQNGAVITEYEPDTPPLPENFPKRNRIISGLSLGVIVVEAALKSGALITAGLAAEQGREVFAVPGKVDSDTSQGTHDLLKDGARLVQNADDVFEELSLQPSNVKKRDCFGPAGLAMTEDERKVCQLLSDEKRHIDEIIMSSGLEPQKVSSLLTQLEIKKIVRQLPGKFYIKEGII